MLATISQDVPTYQSFLVSHHSSVSHIRDFMDAMSQVHRATDEHYSQLNLTEATFCLADEKSVHDERHGQQRTRLFNPTRTEFYHWIFHVIFITTLIYLAIRSWLLPQEAFCLRPTECT